MTGDDRDRVGPSGGVPPFNPYEAPRSGAEAVGPADDAPPVTSATFHLTAEDIKHVREATSSRPALFGMLILLWLIALAMIAQLVLIVSRQGITKATGPVVLPVLILIAIATLMLIARRRRPGESPEEVTVQLTPEGLVIRQGDVGESRRSWSGVGEIRRTPHLILFFLRDFDPSRGKYAQQTVNIVPLRAFPTPEAAESFLAQARRWHAEAVGGG
jgi:hypothetical protein